MTGINIMGLWQKARSVFSRPIPNTADPTQKWLCLVPIATLGGKMGVVWLPLRNIKQEQTPDKHYLWTALAEYDGVEYRVFCTSTEPALSQPADYVWMIQKPPVPAAETPQAAEAVA